MSRRLNANVRIDVYKQYLSVENAAEIISHYDIIADCTDNVRAKYLINDACILAKKPLVSGSVVRWMGQLSVYGYGEDCPCYRCVFPHPPSADAVTSCSDSGVIGPVVGIIGSMQAAEIVKIATTEMSSFAGTLFVYDGYTASSRSAVLRRRATDCIVCGEKPLITKLETCYIPNGCTATANDCENQVMIRLKLDRSGHHELSCV
ncbi:unnamed protein product [Gongylonema pulchrum]|uniref:ThiF domain-containing protein n=1 Tax=Gongylonema pulchrum TaxID=637853 RepID=A0A183E2G8_9BILA|nr:unnamed protein product [Gongylonema pulchrum]